MTRLLLVIAATALLLALANSAPVPTHLMPPESPPFYPTAVGTRLVYDREGG